MVVGVETEAPLAVTKWDKPTKQRVLLGDLAALNELAKLLESEGIEAYDDAVDSHPNYREWAVTMDTSIEVGHELQGWFFPLEIQSRAPPLTLAKD